MSAFLEPPRRIPLWLRPFIWIAERIAGATLLPARVLSWYPKAAVGSGVLEALIAHRDGGVDERMLKLVRLQCSFALACPFCIDMNSADLRAARLNDDELAALQSGVDPEGVATFSERERLAIRYARAISQSPLSFPDDLVAALRRSFTERELVVLASTAAQVNYWGRLIQALGIPPAGFSARCAVPP